jgi:hypothetical protein
VNFDGIVKQVSLAYTPEAKFDEYRGAAATHALAATIAHTVRRLWTIMEIFRHKLHQMTDCTTVNEVIADLSGNLEVMRTMPPK